MSPAAGARPLPWTGSRESVDDTLNDDAHCGASELLPLQQRILQVENPHHWSLPLICDIAPSVTPEEVETIARTLLRQHDGLRARFSRDVAGRWRLMIPPPAVVDDDDDLCSHYDLSAISGTEQARAINAVLAIRAREVQIEQGRLCRVLFFERGRGEKNLLVLLVHHLVVDLFSVMVLFQDLLRAHTQLATNGADRPRRKTASVKEWAGALVEHARSHAVTREAHSWRAHLDRAEGVLPATSSAPHQTRFSTVRAELLDVSQTNALVREAPRSFGTTLDKILAATFAYPLAAWTEKQNVAFTWIHHGRSAQLSGLNVQRTVGPLFNEVPLSARVERAAHPRELISSFANAQDFAERGMTYSALAFNGPDTDLRARLQRHPALRVRLNYGNLTRSFGATEDAPIQLCRSRWAARLASPSSRFDWRVYAQLNVTGPGALGAELIGADLTAVEVQELMVHWKNTLQRVLT